MDDKFWQKEALEWERLYKKSEAQWFDAVRTLASILGMDPEQTSMAEVVKRVGEMMATEDGGPLLDWEESDE